jgi:hypothetical protein
VSFFVLLSLRKVEDAALKAFGYVIAALLWLSVLLVLTGGIYTLSTGKCPLMVAMHQMKAKLYCPMMRGDMMPPPMMEGGMMPGMMGGKGCMMKQGKPSEGPAPKR